MTTPRLHVRRATIEDLPQLKILWQQEQLPPGELEKRFKEFQVIEGANGELAGAIGLETAGLEGRLHSELFLHFDQADCLRELLWQRVQLIAKTFGLVRIWTQLGTPFWPQHDFVSAPEDLIGKLPPQFGNPARPWLFVQLREETANPALGLDQEIALLKAAEHERTERLLRQARTMKILAAIVAFGVFLLALVWAVYFFKLQRQLLPH